MPPDAMGQIFVEVERIAGSFAYAGLLKIVVRRPYPAASVDPSLAP